MSNLKTSTLGIGSIVIGLIQAWVSRDPAAAASALTVGLGLIFARDASNSGS